VPDCGYLAGQFEIGGTTVFRGAGSILGLGSVGLADGWGTSRRIFRRNEGRFNVNVNPWSELGLYLALSKLSITIDCVEIISLATNLALTFSGLIRFTTPDVPSIIPGKTVIKASILLQSHICNSNSKFGNSGRVRRWFALTPALSQVWEREQETKFFAPAPLLPELGEAARAPRVP
jgi:hypothetical protein